MDPVKTIRASWAQFSFAIGAVTLLIGMNGMPVGILVLAAAATFAGLNNMLREPARVRTDRARAGGTSGDDA